IHLRNSAGGGAHLNLNGFHDTIDNLTLDAGTGIRTQGPAGGGVLKVGKLVVAGKSMPRGVYTSSAPWLQGGGYVVVGAVDAVSISGSVDNPNKVIGEGNLAVLKAACSVQLPAGECAIPIDLKTFPLTLTSSASARYSGF